MKNKLFKFLFYTFSLVTLLFALTAGSLLSQGYGMYKEAIKAISIEEKIESRQSQPDYVPLEDISKDFLAAIVSVEDHRFYEHAGIDPVATVRAAMTNLSKGDIVLGGSTITQQLSKNMFFSFEKTYTRKVAELIVALQLEEQLSKNDILELYCNIIYFGNGYYGIEEASMGYFGVPASQLTREQAIQLAGTPKSPNVYNPHANPENISNRSSIVTQAMILSGYLYKSLFL